MRSMGKYKNLLLNIGLFALNSIATKLISFFLIPLYTSYMSAGEYGLTDMANSVISLILPLVTLDMADAAVRHIVGDRENGSKYAAVSFVVTLLSVLLVALLTPLLDLGAFGGLGDFKVWFVVDYASVAFMTLCGEVARGSGAVRLIPICAVVSSVTTLICAVIFIAWMGLGIIGYFASVSIGPALAIIVYLAMGGLGLLVVGGIRELAHGSIELIRETFLPMVRYALPLIPNSLFWWAGTSINRLFITGMMGISASGMFAAASKVPSLINTAYSIFLQAWQLSAFQEAKDEGVSSFYATVWRLVSAGLTVLCSILSLFAPWLASILLKGETFDAWPMIPVLLVANLMNAFNSFYGTVYTSTMHTAYIMRTTVFGALSCVIFTPLLIPMMGTYGACLASVIGQGLVFLLRARDSRKYISFDAGWWTLVPTLSILAVQAAVTAARASGWQVISVICTVVVLFIQGNRLLPLFRAIVSRVVKRQ